LGRCKIKIILKKLKKNNAKYANNR
jgi:hypothetical protein